MLMFCCRKYVYHIRILFVYGTIHVMLLNDYQSFTKRQILDASKLKEFADDNFKFDENERKFLKWVENTVGKGEIARYEQFLLFPQCFQNTCTEDIKNQGLFGKGLNVLCNDEP